MESSYFHSRVADHSITLYKHWLLLSPADGICQAT